MQEVNHYDAFFSSSVETFYLDIIEKHRVRVKAGGVGLGSGRIRLYKPKLKSYIRR